MKFLATAASISGSSKQLGTNCGRLSPLAAVVICLCTPFPAAEGVDLSAAQKKAKDELGIDRPWFLSNIYELSTKVLISHLIYMLSMNRNRVSRLDFEGTLPK